MILMFVGWPGTGKTQLMQDIVRKEKKHTYLVCDRAGEWGRVDFDGVVNPRWRGKPPAILDVKYQEPERVIPAIYDRPNGVYLFRHPWLPEDIVRIAIGVGNCVYVDDEIDTFATIHDWQSNPLREIAHRGRHLPNVFGDICEMHLMGAMRRPQSVTPDITALADKAFIFRVSGELTLARFKRDSWIENDEWDKIRLLKNLHYKEWPANRYHHMRNAFRPHPQD